MLTAYRDTHFPHTRKCGHPREGRTGEVLRSFLRPQNQLPGISKLAHDLNTPEAGHAGIEWSYQTPLTRLTSGVTPPNFSSVTKRQQLYSHHRVVMRIK